MITITDTTPVKDLIEAFSKSGTVITTPTNDGNIVTSFGADPTGTKDSTAAINAALASNLSSIYVPAGRYLVSSNLLCSKTIHLYGDVSQSSVIVMQNNSSFVYTGGDSSIYDDISKEYVCKQLYIERLSFRCPTITPKKVIDARWTGGSGNSTVHAVFRDIEVTGDSASGGFGTAIYLENCNNAVINSVRILGDRNDNILNSGIGIHMHGTGFMAAGTKDDGAPTDIFITDSRLFYLNTGIVCSGWVEGVVIKSSTMILCNTGVEYTDSTAHPMDSPLINVHNCHLNTRSYGIKTSGIVQSLYTHNLFYQFAFDTDGIGASPYVGISITTDASKVDTHIKDNTFMQTAYGGKAVGDRIGIQLVNGNIAQNADNIMVSGNIINNCGVGIQLSPGTLGAIIHDTNVFYDCVQKIVDLGANVICAAQPSSSATTMQYSKTSPDGMIEKWGTSVVTFNSAGTAVVKYGKPFSGAFITAVATIAETNCAGTVIVTRGPDENLNKSNLYIMVKPAPGVITTRINWIAKGTQ